MSSYICILICFVHKFRHNYISHFLIFATTVLGCTVLFYMISGADVFNALDLNENETVFKELQFGAGDGHLQYYIFNWKCEVIEASDVGLVLV